MSVKERVRQFIAENFYVDEAELGDDVSLISGGFVDSTGILEVITFLESEYRFRISEREMTPENLETIGRIASFVAGKQQALAG
jgi:acyl carrier protein